MKYIYWALVVSVLLTVQSETALAADGLSVEPVFQDLSFSAEVPQVDFLITLSNTSAEALTLRSSVVDFGSLDASGGVAFLGASDNLAHKYALASWMRPEKDAVFLDAGETETLKIVIENRESLSPGGHYGAVLFQVSHDENIVESNVVAVNQLISVLVFAKKQGGEVYKLNLRERQWNTTLFQGVAEGALRFQNEGNVHVVPRGTILVKDPLGRMVQKGVINSESGIVLPESERTLITRLSSLALLLVPGRYTMLTSYRYDGQETFETVTDTRVLVPWLSILGLGVLFVLIFGWRFVKKRSDFLKNTKS